jgi:hypothetical protein
MKKCFYCKRKLPLILFNTNNCTYQVKADLGKTVSCRICSIKRAIKQNGYMTKVDNKFVFVQANKWEIIKKYLICNN